MKAVFLPLIAIALVLTPAALGVTLYYSDTFESSNASWVVNTTTTAGGPSGDFLAVTSSGAPTGQGSRPAIRNDSSNWTGDFASITRIDLDVMNATASAGPLNLRMVVFNNGNRFTSTVAQEVPNDGNWSNLTFSLEEAALTQVRGTSSYSDTLSSVTRLMFRHDAGGPSDRGTELEASFGFDNITAVPEPSGAVLLLLGTLLTVVRRR